MSDWEVTQVVPVFTLATHFAISDLSKCYNPLHVFISWNQSELSPLLQRLTNRKQEAASENELEFSAGKEF